MHRARLTSNALKNCSTSTLLSIFSCIDMREIFQTRSMDKWVAVEVKQCALHSGVCVCVSHSGCYCSGAVAVCGLILGWSV